MEKKIPIKKFWVVSQDGELISDPYPTFDEANNYKESLVLGNPEANYFIESENIGFIDENNNKYFYHTCCNCKAQFYNENDSVSNYCCNCEPKQSNVDWDELEDEQDNDNESLNVSIQSDKPDEVLTISQLRLAEVLVDKVVEFCVKPALEKADEIIAAITKKPKKTSKVRFFNTNDELVSHVYKQPAKEEKIVFTNRANTEYKVVKEDLLNLGYQESYKDLLNKSLDPIVSKDKPVFGYGKVLQPLNKTIAAMKESIDQATATAQDRYNKHLEAQAKAKAEAEAKVNIPAQGGKDSANN